jgi:hypothetical protein
VFVRSKAYVCDLALPGIVGSNPTGGMDVCLLWVFVLSGRGLCNGTIPRPEESYRLWCVSEYDQGKNKQPRHLLWVGRRGKDYETQQTGRDVEGSSRGIISGTIHLFVWKVWVTPGKSSLSPGCVLKPGVFAHVWGTCMRIAIHSNATCGKVCASLLRINELLISHPLQS